MPLYEYQCDACEGRIERIRKFSDPPLEDPCPTCGGHLTKLISSPAIQFKGAGWYVNDYAKSGSSTTGTATAAKGEAAEKKGAAETKSDTKTESKTESKTETKTSTTPSKD
ncbi:MAG: zinc ribbon domain-containing protein [Acidobacteria bacterium]|nr:zinc ribbon domain-containing protein [Acidobacteriota bacterium]